MLECLLQLYYSYLLSYGEYVFRIWENKQTNKQKLFVKCLWMNWLIATNIYNVNKNAWGNIYIAEKKTIKARAIWPNFKSLVLAKNQRVPISAITEFKY